MDPKQNPSDNPRSTLRNNYDSNYEYYYFKDHEGRIQRVRKLAYRPRPGYIRLKFIEKWYLKFNRSSYDSKLTWLPWVIGLAVCAFIYYGTMAMSQNELNREIKARLPFEYKNEQVKEVYRLLREHEEEQKRKGKEEEGNGQSGSGKRQLL